MLRNLNADKITNSMLQDFSATACKTVLVQLLKQSGLMLIIDDVYLDKIMGDYLHILSFMDELSAQYVDSHTLMHFYWYLYLYCRSLIKDNYIISIFSIDNLLVPALLVASKVTNDESVHAKDFTRIAAKFNIRVPNVTQFIKSESQFLQKIEYKLYLPTVQACQIYSLVKQEEAKNPKLFWGHFFKSYFACIEDAKSIGNYGQHFKLKN